MAEPKKVFLAGPDGTSLAELVIDEVKEGWFIGRVVAQNFPSAVKKALAWYDEVLRDQMLSYLDEATAAVERLELRAHFPDGSAHKVYFLYVSPMDAASFRISPVAEPPELKKSVSSDARIPHASAEASLAA